MTKMNLPETKAFISYSHLDKQIAGYVNEVLTGIGIDGFLAHEHIDASKEWRERILEELRYCDLFIPLLSEDFRKSDWTSQEVGFIVSRLKEGVKIVPFSIDETVPYGFFSHIQSVSIQRLDKIYLVELLIGEIPRKILPGLIRDLRKARTYYVACEKMAFLEPYFSKFTEEEAQALAEVSLENNQVYGSWICWKEWLSGFIDIHRSHINSDTLKELEERREKTMQEKPKKKPPTNSF